MCHTHIYTATNCSGQCHGGGGVPACYIRDGDTERVTNITSDGIALIGTDTPLDQYTDTRNGPQCICYQVGSWSIYTQSMKTGLCRLIMFAHCRMSTIVADV
jgi:hypothetical protein